MGKSGYVHLFVVLSQIVWHPPSGWLPVDFLFVEGRLKRKPKQNHSCAAFKLPNQTTKHGEDDAAVTGITCLGPS